METRKRGFTIVEILTVVGIIALLVGILIPAITKVRTSVKETQQRAQLTTIGLAITAFKNDYGDYPPSDFMKYSNNDYTGAQMLTEALVGWDLMGFHPESDWESDGRYANNNMLYELATTGSQQQQEENLRERKGPYLEQGSYEAYRLKDVLKDKNGNLNNTYNLNIENYVLCDIFGKRTITLSNGQKGRPGAPILYYRARTNSKIIDRNDQDHSIYDWKDNALLVKALEEAYSKQFKIDDDQFFYEEYIRDPRIEDRDWPYRPDSYLLISAGADGEYGTVDDITNFK
jgi:prepilin-type N-terminal cleavage/methylation domain-containing protein